MPARQMSAPLHLRDDGRDSRDVHLGDDSPGNSLPTMLRWPSPPAPPRRPRRRARRDGPRCRCHTASGRPRRRRRRSRCAGPAAGRRPRAARRPLRRRLELRLQRMDDRCAASRSPSPAAELDQPRQLPRLDPLLDARVERAAEADVRLRRDPGSGRRPARCGSAPSGRGRLRLAPRSRACRRGRRRRRAPRAHEPRPARSRSPR